MRRPVPDRFCESADQQLPSAPLTGSEPAEGLQKFDLGMTPASVTPPPTWRRAAWFTVIASAAALGGLILASSLLVDYSRSSRGLDLPQQLSPDGDPPSGTPVLAAQGLRSAQTPRWSPLADEGVGLGARQPARLPMVGAVVPIPLVPPLPVPSGTEAVQQRCDQYFAALQDGDLRGAYAMTSDGLHAEGFAAFASRYAAATSIEVTEIAAEADHLVTAVRITWADGTVGTQRRELWFSRGESPMISADDLVS